MKITSVDSIGLSGMSPKGGWSHEIKPEDSVHSLIIIRTDDGKMGARECFHKRRPS